MRPVHYRIHAIALLCFALLLGAPEASAQSFALTSDEVADSAALARSMPRLAAEVLATYEDADRLRFLDNLFRLQILTGRYAEAEASLAELRRTRADSTPQTRARYVQYEIFVRARALASAQVASLHTARAAHTATTLPSGQVLVVGGMGDGGGGLASVELFDPADNAVQELGSLAERRAGHTATLLADGRVLVAGGYNGEYLRSVEVFDPTTRRFSPAGSLVEGRSGHTATLLPDGRVLFVGGSAREGSSVEGAALDRPLFPRLEYLQASKSSLVGA